ncbi:MAG: hypothetical protein ACR2JB_17020 [Bryobacteraceae bacterium]
MLRSEHMEICSLPALRLENDLISLSILPDPGAKIYDLVWKPSRRQILWQNPRILPQRFPIDSNFDNYWCGGWDEGFPTCDACEHNGESYPNLGELRSIRWNVDNLQCVGEDAIAELSAFGPITPVRALKRIAVCRGTVSIHCELLNLGPLGFDFIWGSHPALKVTPSTILHIPAETGVVQLSSSASFGSPGQQYAWPVIQTPVGHTDMSRIPPAQTGTFCGHYATGLRGSSYGLEFGGEDLGLILEFPREQCPSLWMWLVYGGWRGYYHAIIEPWTSCPVNLAEAVRQNTHKRLEPGQTFCVDVKLRLQAGLADWRNEMRRVESA